MTQGHKEFLLFRLHGNMCSWGDATRLSIRKTLDHPTKSAVVGLIANACGIDRSDTNQLLGLSREIQYACLVEREPESPVLRDYHTIATHTEHSQSRLTRAELAAYCRAMEACNKQEPGKYDGTILSERFYLVGASYIVAIGDEPDKLRQIAHALQYPARTLFLGRKCNTPSLYLAPCLVKAENIIEALAQWSQTPLGKFAEASRAEKHGNSFRALFAGSKRKKRVFWEGDIPNMRPTEEKVRRDQYAFISMHAGQYKTHYDARKEYCGFLEDLVCI